MFDSLKDTTLTLAARATEEEKEAFLDRIEKMDRITELTFHETGKTIEGPRRSAQQLYDEGGISSMGAMIFLMAKNTNSGMTKFVMDNCGVFENGSIITIFKAKGFQRSGFRGRLKDLLVRWNLIEEF